MAELTGVTITGADDTTSLLDLVALSHEFPFVEWGFLLGRGIGPGTAIGDGLPRFPSHAWLRAFASLADPEPRVRYALHFCGGFVASAIRGEDPAGSGDLHLFTQHSAARIQLNFRGREQHVDVPALAAWMKSRPHQKVILQLGGTIGGAVFEHMRQYVPGVQGLFDRSGGRGTVPGAWPTPKSVASYGYAGGLGPKNLSVEWPLISAAAGDRRVWIDMETGVRDDADETLDLGRARAALEWAAPVIAEAGPRG